MATIPRNDLGLIKEYKSDPSNRKNRQALNTLYWDMVFSLIREKANGGSAEQIDLSDELPFINSGLIDKSLIEGGDEEIKAVAAENIPHKESLILQFADWIVAEYQRILNFDKQDAIKNDISDLKHQIIVKDKDIEAKKDERRSSFIAALEEALQSRGLLNSPLRDQTVCRLEKAQCLDDLKLTILRRQKEVATGKFLDVQGKRELASWQQDYLKQQTTFRNVLTEIRNPSQEKELVAVSEEINTLMAEKVDIENKMARKEVELKTLSMQSSMLSPVEVEAQLNSSLDYFKGLMSLCAKRVRAESFSVWTAQTKPITVAKLQKVIKLVEEFDPKVFKNERAKYLGLPKFIILPGFGNSLYDWKNNAILVPLFSPGKIEDSLFAGIVEYKLDMDEDKALLMSYNKIEENRGIRSIIRLKEKFAKDYSVFMGMETRGYKVLPKAIRIWFNHEIAPGRNDIKVPLKYDPVAMSREAYEAMRLEFETVSAGSSPTVEALYGMGIFNTRDELFDKAAECFEKAHALDSENLDVLYNLAMVHIKRNSRREAVERLTEFLKKSPQNWWTGVCQEHLMKLR